MRKGVQLGLQYLEEGEYTVNGGLGDKVLAEMKVEDGVLYVKKDGEWIVKMPPPFSEFKMSKELQLPKKSLFKKLFG